MKKLLERFPLPKEDYVVRILHTLSPFERFALGVLLAFVVGSFLWLLFSVNQLLVVEVPTQGGVLREGVVGSPRFINPLLALSDADRDLTTLVYSGLMKAAPDGTLIPDLAESYTLSSDRLVYTFTLKEGVTFHDGTPVTPADVVFTVERAQDSTLKSPKRANWEGVEVTALNDREVQFALHQPYAPFLENTTLGIIPKHLWGKIDGEAFPFSTLNTEPIGSGPYRLKKAERSASGIPTRYELEPFADYALGKPFIEKIIFRFYSNEDALVEAFKHGDINAINSISPEKIAALQNKKVAVFQVPLPRIFGVFFNQNQMPIFARQPVRRALETAVDKERIVEVVLSGYGTAIDGPLPVGLLAKAEQTSSSENHTERAIEILAADGWSPGEDGIAVRKKSKTETEQLAFSLSTSHVPELKKAAELLKADWEKIGATVDLKIFDTSDLNQNAIRPRKYDALLFGEIVGRDLDLFAFWHSSQRNDPGLNIALYANITADKLLEEARGTGDTRIREEKYTEFAEEVSKDVPAVFLYSPDFVYLVPIEVKGINLDVVTTPEDRFLNVHEWHIRTEKVWPFLSGI